MGYYRRKKSSVIIVFVVVKLLCPPIYDEHQSKLPLDMRSLSLPRDSSPKDRTTLSRRSHNPFLHKLCTSTVVASYLELVVDVDLRGNETGSKIRSACIDLKVPIDLMKA